MNEQDLLVGRRSWGNDCKPSLTLEGAHRFEHDVEPARGFGMVPAGFVPTHHRIVERPSAGLFGGGPHDVTECQQGRGCLAQEIPPVEAVFAGYCVIRSRHGWGMLRARIATVRRYPTAGPRPNC